MWELGLFKMNNQLTNVFINGTTFCTPSYPINK